MAKQDRRLVLNSLENVRRSISRLARDLYSNDFKNDLDASDYKLLLDMLREVVTCHKLEANVKKNRRVEEIVKALRQKGIMK
jgi:predicted transcriptional regulator YheO